MKRIKHLFTPFFLLLLLSGCQESSQKEAKNTPQEEAKSVQVERVQLHSFTRTIELSGIAKPNQQVNIFAMSSGYLEELRFDIGDHVRRGEVVAVLDNPELQTQKLKLKAKLKAKQALYERLQTIYDKTPQLTSVIDVENAQAEYESLKAQLQSVLIQMSYLHVKAPFSGVITKRFVDKGALVQNGLLAANATALYELQEMTPMRINAEVAEADAAFIKKGMQAKLLFPELPLEAMEANVSRIAFGLNFETRTMEIELDIPNKEMKIHSGMYAKIEFQERSAEGTLAVPNEALVNIKGQLYLYLIREERVHRVAVKTALRDAAFTQIIEGDVTLDDEVVTQGKELCVEGAKVQLSRVSRSREG